MKSSAVIPVGIFGGLIAIIPVLLGFEATPWLMVEPTFWIWAFLFPGMGLLGGPLVLAKPKVAGIMMLIGGIIGPFGFIAFGIPDEIAQLVICALAAAFLIPGGAFALARDIKHPAAIYVGMLIGIIGGLIALPSTFVLPVYILVYIFEEVPRWWWHPLWWLPHGTWILVLPGLLGGLVAVKPKMAGIVMLISGIIGPFGFVVLKLLLDVPFDIAIARERETWFIASGVVGGLLLIIAGAIACIKSSSSSECSPERT